MGTINIPKLLNDYDIIVVEGYDMTGKSTFIKDVVGVAKQSGINAVVYRPDWENVVKPEVVNRGNRYIQYLDFLSTIKLLRSSGMPLDSKFILDRSYISHLMYSQLYPEQSVDYNDINDLLDSIEEVNKDLKIVVIHIQHTASSIELLHNFSASKSDDHSDIYDILDIDDYTEKYLRAEKLYANIYMSSRYKLATYFIEAVTDRVISTMNLSEDSNSILSRFKDSKYFYINNGSIHLLYSEPRYFLDLSGALTIITSDSYILCSVSKLERALNLDDNIKPGILHLTADFLGGNK